jgi:hypothetical protein
MQYLNTEGLTAERASPVALPEVGHEVLEVHGASRGVVAPVVHLAAPVETHSSNT